MPEPNEDLIGASYTDTWDPPRVRWEVTGLAIAPGYVNLTRTVIETGDAVETCMPAQLVRLRVKERGQEHEMVDGPLGHPEAS